MSKQKVILLAVATMFISYSAANAVPSGPFGYDLQADMHRSENKQQDKQQDKQQGKNTADDNQANQVDMTPKVAKDFYSFVPMKDLYVETIDHSKYYSNPTMNSAIAKYKKGNYTGCLQELYAFIANPKNVNNAYAYYYMGLSYSKIGESTAAKNCFQKVINCDAKGKLFEQALKGRDCISGGIYCHTPVNPTFDQINQLNGDVDQLDAFINAPYTGRGFSPEAEKDYQQRQLNNVQKKINSKDNLNVNDIQDLKNIDNEKKK